MDQAPSHANSLRSASLLTVFDDLWNFGCCIGDFDDYSSLASTDSDSDDHQILSQIDSDFNGYQSVSQLSIPIRTAENNSPCMHSLNPFLRAFFRSSFPAQCIPVNQYILLVPTTEVLVTNKDSESDALYTDIVNTEDFICSHVLKVPSLPIGEGGKENGNIRESRNKAKPFTTLNGRTVVIKESFAYSNKGFKTLNQAQLLTDSLYYHDTLEAQQWLIYYISKPLIGTSEPMPVTIATVPGLQPRIEPNPEAESSTHARGQTVLNVQTTGKVITSFNDVLNQFPMIARQLQPGLERVFKDFNKEIGKPLPAIDRRSSTSARSRSSSMSSEPNSNGSIHSSATRRHAKRISITSISSTYADDEEDHMRHVFESAVNASIDLLNSVDKQQLSLLGSTTELTGPAVERLMERYVAEHVNDAVLFPRLRSIHQKDDYDLEARIRHMINVDVAQVGIDIEGGKAGKRKFTTRLKLAVDEFRKLSTASSPHLMLDILLETQKILSGDSVGQGNPSGNDKIAEKFTPMNADTLVSSLLLVVIRSQVRHLQARLAYVRNFIFIDDVESGELGYALSTFEAVLQYIAIDSGGLRVASRRNKRLWFAAKKGNLSEMRTILEPDNDSISDETDSLIGDDLYDDEPRSETEMNGFHHSNATPETKSSDVAASSIQTEDSRSQSANLGHVFPFQVAGSEHALERTKTVKRVSMDLRSLSGASEYSFRSRSSTTNSRTSFIEGDTSTEKLCQSEDQAGDSVLMMAIEARQPEALDYLLSLDAYYPMSAVIEDTNLTNATLLSAAVQTAHSEIISIMVDYIMTLRDSHEIQEYLRRPDNMGRTFAHYLFHAPYLISRLGKLLPWKLKDKNGQTPLLALCRSYDHPHYIDMVNQAMQFVVDDQSDGQPLHLDDHIDAKGNTLLHAVTDPYLVLRILQHCDADPNARNFKLFTPLMSASKYGRFDLVRMLYLDPRVDALAKEYRGMTAVELAKDDDIRNRIDDLAVVSDTPMPNGRVTAIVRSFFVEDGSIRLIIKTADRADDAVVAVTSCRRSLADFENLAKWLAVEHPASWLPSIFNFRSPFQVPSKPSRAVLQDIQFRLNKFLKIMLAHSTFSTHELLWEFILLPEVQPDMMGERSLKKSEIRQENILEEHTPIEDVKDVELFVIHARESVRPVNHAIKSVLRRVTGMRNASLDLYNSLDLVVASFCSLPFLPPQHATSLGKYAQAHLVTASDPFASLHTSLLSIHGTVLSILSSLSRPHAQITTLTTAQKALERHRSTVRKASSGNTGSGWPLAGLLEENRRQAAAEAAEKMDKAAKEVRVAGCELAYTYHTVAGELAGWQDLHGKLVKAAVRDLAKGMVVKEKLRLDAMKRALRSVKEANKMGQAAGSGQ